MLETPGDDVEGMWLRVMSVYPYISLLSWVFMAHLEQI